MMPCKSSVRRYFSLLVLCLSVQQAVLAQVGEHRNDFAVGINGGLSLSNVGFSPTVPQSMKTGYSFGATFRYTCEKYFSSICALQGEINMAQIGWKEDIKDINDNRVVNPETGEEEEYSRSMYYVQMPIFARLGWGRERKGAQFYFMAGPQFGLFLSEKIDKNYTEPNISARSSHVIKQETMDIEKKFDYGIAAALGFEYSHPKMPHLALDVRYYYGLGDIYGSSKHDYFGKSNFGNIVIRVHCLFDLIKTKNDKIK